MNPWTILSYCQRINNMKRLLSFDQTKTCTAISKPDNTRSLTVSNTRQSSSSSKYSDRRKHWTFIPNNYRFATKQGRGNWWMFSNENYHELLKETRLSIEAFLLSPQDITSYGISDNHVQNTTNSMYKPNAEYILFLDNSWRLGNFGSMQSWSLNYNGLWHKLIFKQHIHTTADQILQAVQLWTNENNEILLANVSRHAKPSCPIKMWRINIINIVWRKTKPSNEINRLFKDSFAFYFHMKYAKLDT